MKLADAIKATPQILRRDRVTNRENFNPDGVNPNDTGALEAEEIRARRERYVSRPKRSRNGGKAFTVSPITVPRFVKCSAETKTKKNKP